MKKERGHLTRLIAVVLAMALSMAMFPAVAEENAEASSSLVYELRTDADTGEEYAVITNGDPAEELTIPASIEGYPVRAVAEEFRSKTKGWDKTLRKLVVEEGITAIGAYAFSGCKNLQTVQLPDGLREIGDSAFQNCVSLTEINLPESISFIGDAALVNIAAEGLSRPKDMESRSSAFWYATLLRKDETGKGEYGLLEDGTAVITWYTPDDTTLTIPDTIDGIPVTMLVRAPLGKIDYAQVRKIKKVVLPQELKALDHLAFEFCSGLTKVDLPAGLESLGYGVFRDCSALRSVTIPEGITRIGRDAFARCTKLAFPKLPASVTEIDSQAFLRCAGLGAVSLPASVRTIGEQAFATCFIKKLTLTEGLEVIGRKAFLANELTAVELPASLTEIGDAAFDQRGGRGKGIKTVTFKSIKTKIGKGVLGYDDGGDEYYINQRNERSALDLSTTTFDPDNTAYWHDYYGDSGKYGQGTITVTCYPGSSADKLYQYNVVKKYLKLTDAAAETAPAEKVLQAGLYDESSGVYELIVPEGVEEIGDYALAGLSTMIKITLPSTLQKIGSHAFEQCTGLTEIALPKQGMVSIGEAAFRGCTELTKINVPDGITEIAAQTFEGCSKLKTLTMPKSGVISIGDRAFADCSVLTTLILNPGLQSIGREVLSGCGVKEAKIPDSATFIAPKAFYNSRLQTLKLPADMEEIPEQLCAFSGSLNNLTMPKNTKKIGKSAFEQCPIASLTLPEGLETICEKAFAFDEYMALINYGKAKTSSRLRSLKIPESLTVIERRAFFGNDALTGITFPKNPQLTKIGEEAFSHCTGLSTIKLPGCIRAIGKSAFSKCMQLKKAELEDGITKIPDRMFASCTNMRDLKIPASVTEIGEDILVNVIPKIVVTCPEGSAMQTYMEVRYPAIKLKLSKQ